MLVPYQDSLWNNDKHRITYNLKQLFIAVLKPNTEFSVAHPAEREAGSSSTDGVRITRAWQLFVSNLTIAFDR